MRPSGEYLELVAGVAAEVKPRIAHISVPVRPPTERWVKPTSEESPLTAYEILSRKTKVELLTSIEPPPLAASDPIKYISAKTSLYPLKLEHAIRLLEEERPNPHQALKQLEDRGLIRIIGYGGRALIMRRL